MTINRNHKNAKFLKKLILIKKKYLKLKLKITPKNQIKIKVD